VSEQRNYKQPPPRGSARNILLTLAFGMIGASLLLAQVDGQSEADTLISSAAASTSLAPLIIPPVELTRLVLPGWLERDTTTPRSPMRPADDVRPSSEWIEVTVKSGQTFSTVVEGLGMPRSDWAAVLALKGDASRLSRIRVGDTLRFKVKNNRLAGMEYALDELTTLQISRNDVGLQAATQTASVEHRQTFASGQIDSSLFASGLEAGLSNRLIMEMAEIFGYQIDFALELRRGDRFTVVYEELYKDGKRLREGRILAAEFVNQNRQLQAFRHEDSDGRGAYYTAKGDALKTGFRRTPLDFARISSPFNPNRRHPVLNTIRAHKGVDYGASTGTPIRATGDGRIKHRGVMGGYGQTVVVQHNGGIDTLYAHMSRYRSGLKVGSRVSQGQVIGYVGSTGLATGPHLHYEFRVNGVHKNPVTVALPRATPLQASQIAKWSPQVQGWLAELEQINKRQLAMKNNSELPN
jgi:murein DD-endopeptidase MepM/ murein hydrolase activator NlpD